LAALKTWKVERCSHLSACRSLRARTPLPGYYTMARSSLGRRRVVYARSAVAERAFFVSAFPPRVERIGDACTAALEEVK